MALTGGAGCRQAVQLLKVDWLYSIVDGTVDFVKGFGRRPIAIAREGTGAVVRKRPGKEPAGS